MRIRVGVVAGWLVLAGAVAAGGGCGGESFGTGGGASGAGGGGAAGGGAAGEAGEAGLAGAAGVAGHSGAAGGDAGLVDAGPGCPVARPKEGSDCALFGQACGYPSGCCEDEYRCEAGEWVHDGCVGPAVEPSCPDDAPADGASCDLCFDLPECFYDACDTLGMTAAAHCDGARWKTDVEPCAPPIECGYGSTFVDQFDKSCLDMQDCRKITIGLDCCGTALVAGVNQADFGRAKSEWNACLPMLPVCGCPGGPPVAEDGQSSTDPNAIALGCRSGRCETFVP